jgi:Ni,Fe-hydrogenase I small subunit
MSLLNSAFYTTVDDLLINTLDLNFHDTVMTACGSPQAPAGTANALTASANAYSGADNATTVPLYVLVVEGGIQCASPPGGGIGDYCTHGDLTGTGPETMLANTQLFASHALAVLSVGTCSSFGGVPGAKGSATDSRGCLYKGTKYGQGALLDPTVAYTNAPVFSNAVNILNSTTYAFDSATPLTNILGMPISSVTVNIAGCPPHPDWIVGTIASIVSQLPPVATLVGLVNDVVGGSTTALPILQSTLKGALPQVTNYARPRDYGYGEYQCNAGPCTWRYNNATSRAKNTDSYGSWTPAIFPYTGITTEWTQPGGPAGTNAPSQTYYTGNADFNPRYPQGDSKALGRNKYTGNDLGCLGILGCKGRKTKADCSRRRWNTANAEQYGVNWCVGSRGSCQGCTEPTFPDGVGKFFTFI